MYDEFLPFFDPMFMRCPIEMEPMMIPIEMDKRLAKAYVLDQPFVGILPLEKALKRGTIFPNIPLS
ncbi:MAG: spore coat associated protein CotJA [Bacillota bacterium]|nr:spore coat associated protein CotJA [Bacillota bacterium]